MKYAYDGGVLRTITDGQGRVYTLTFNERYDLKPLQFSQRAVPPVGVRRQGKACAGGGWKGNVTRYAYDRADNLIRLEEPDGNVHRFEYDAMGNMVHASDNIREVRFTYRGAGGIEKPRAGQTLDYIRLQQRASKLRRIGNEAGDNYFFELDGLGQVVTEIGFDGLRREYERDGAGRVTRVNRSRRKMDGIPV